MHGTMSWHQEPKPFEPNAKIRLQLSSQLTELSWLGSAWDAVAWQLNSITSSKKKPQVNCHKTESSPSHFVLALEYTHCVH